MTDTTDYKPNWELTVDEKKKINQYQISYVKRTNTPERLNDSHEQELK